MLQGTKSRHERHHASALNTKSDPDDKCKRQPVLVNAGRSPSPTRHDFAPSYPPPDWQRAAFPDRGPGTHSEPGGAPTTYYNRPVVGLLVHTGSYWRTVVLRNAELWLRGHCQSSPVSSLEFWASLPHPCTAKRIQRNATQRNATQRYTTTRKRLVCTVTPDDDACSGLDYSSAGNDIGGSISIGSGHAVVSTPPLPGWLIKQSSQNLASGCRQ